MDVKKIFTMLIGVVACVVIGALLLNTIMPNAAAAISNSIEGMIFNATGIQMDFNGDGIGGEDNSDQEFDAINDQEAEQVSGNVTGFGGTTNK